MSRLLDSDAAMRVGLRNRLDELAEERQRLLSQLMYIERTIKETLDAINRADGLRPTYRDANVPAEPGTVVMTGKFPPELKP